MLMYIKELHKMTKICLNVEHVGQIGLKNIVKIFLAMLPNFERIGEGRAVLIPGTLTQSRQNKAPLVSEKKMSDMIKT